MIKTLWPQTSAVLLAGSIFSAGAAMAQDGPGRDYARINSGAYSIVAEVSAKPRKETELCAITLPLIELVRGDPASDASRFFGA
jgi:hypothetical protein